MESRIFLIFCILLAICSAKLCPYTKEKFIKTLTLGDMRSNVERDYLITAACYQELDEDYTEAVNKFMEDMTKMVAALYKIFTSFEPQKRNNAYHAGKALQKLAEELIKYRDFLKTLGSNTENKALLYSIYVFNFFGKHYDEYLKHIKFFENRNQNNPKAVKNTIHTHCEPAFKAVEKVTKDFDACMKRRISGSQPENSA